jgi:hypothetical protein
LYREDNSCATVKDLWTFTAMTICASIPGRVRYLISSEISIPNPRPSQTPIRGAMLWGSKTLEQNNAQYALRHYTLLFTDTEASLSEIYSVPVIFHILPTLVNLQGDDQLNRAE